mgnify:CR=1 FL=1
MPFALVVMARLNDNPREMWLIELGSVIERVMTTFKKKSILEFGGFLKSFLGSYVILPPGVF